MLKEELCLLSNMAMMDAFPHKKRPLTRSCSFGDTITASSRFQAFTKTTNQCQEGKGVLRQRRKTVASFMPHSTDQNGNFPEKDVDIQGTKSFSGLNTEEVCQWFTSIGLQKCLPFIRVSFSEAKLCGGDIASVDANTLAILHIVTLEDKEQLLSAIYNELHPPSTISQTLSSLTENLGPHNVEDFSTTPITMTKSKSSPQVSCLNMNQRSLKLRNHSQNHMVQRNSQMIEITINASERIVHLRTPKETTVGKIMDSCFKMLGMTDKNTLLALKEKQDSPRELSPEQQIGTLLPSTSDNRQLELHLCKREKPTLAQNGPEVSNPWENGNKNVQGDQSAKEERIRELNQQVDSLQNVIFQVQELHHDLVAFCTELKSMDTDVNLETLGAAELKKRLEMINSQLNDKRQSLQTLRDNINNPTAHKKKQLEVHLMEKMKINCQVFKKEISIVHLNRQATQLQNALQECYIKEKAQTKASTFGCLSRLVSPQSPAMLIAVHENQSHDGHYGFTCLHREGSGLEVAEVENSNLCVEDRLVEVNGVSVVNSTLSELTDLLLQGPCAQIVVLRQPPPILTSPLFLQNPVSPDPVQTVSPERGVVTKETPPQRKLMTI
ncbi:uncharacterized protein ACNS7B_018122 isoform 1-T2 [Menidia menidia]